MAQTAFLAHLLTTGDILCLACAHACKLSEGEYGICGVRHVQNGELKLLTYGRVAALNIDPIEKKPLFHFLPASRSLSLGTVGCNLSCTFCQNHEISQYPKEHDHQIIGQHLSPKQIVDLALHHGCESISYTYNEPVVSFEYTYDTAVLAKEKSIKNVYVTSGFETKKATKLLSSCIEGMNIDLKSFRDEFYQTICGARLKPVLETIDYAKELGIWVEITTLIIPGHNDTPQELEHIASFIAKVDPSIPWHISAFHPMYKMLTPPRTSPQTLAMAYSIGKEAGLHYVYTGNIDDATRSSTFCPKCYACVIERHGYLGENVTIHLSNKGLCPHCHYPLKGVWN